MPYVPMKPLSAVAQKLGVAHGAFNINLLQQVDAVIKIHEKLRSAAIIQVAEPATAFLGGNPDFLNGSLSEKALGMKRIAERVKKLSKASRIPVVLHLDHGRSFESVKLAIDAGFSSVMIDGSSLPYEENVALTKKVVDYAHERGVSVEGELGILAGTEDDVFAEESSYTNPLLVVDFFKKTECDSLAISYGTKHGAAKGANVKLRKEIVIASLENLRHEKIQGTLVSHGSSLVPEYIISEINSLGGAVSGHGIPLEQLREVIPLGISKINIDTDIRLATTRNILELYKLNPDYTTNSQVYDLLKANPKVFDYRNYLVPYLEDLLAEEITNPELEKIVKALENAIYEICATAIINFGSVGTAFKVEALSLEEMAEIYRGEK
ncbi:MAG TPA: ketose-bisphosphate aldolase [Acholeplasmataceae bacterium]|jgi:fructose-bisphosphate aldolase class II|nr:ketose-bisphosphate aldolase [Acholeplasmataceae bacterium]